MHTNNKRKKSILVVGEGITQELDDTTLTAEKKNSINFTENSKKLCLSLHYNEANSYFFVSGKEIIKFKAKEYQNTKIFLLKDILQIGLIKKVKNTVPWTYVINDLNGEEIIETFYEKELQKTNQKEFRIEKAIKRKGNKLYVKWQGYDNSFNSWIDKKDVLNSIKMSQYFPKPYEPFWRRH